MIMAVRSEIKIPLITGGGLNSAEKIDEAFSAGADMIVIGNGCEQNSLLVVDACLIRDTYNKRELSV
jgi:putative glycerol-1-phosphate prenyltransferase